MNLFKLKKDGKTVGYAHINKYGQLMFRFPTEDEWQCREIFWTNMIEKYGFGLPPCEYFPYVCDDKNGDNVFAGDRMQHYAFDKGDTFIVEWSKECGCWSGHGTFREWKECELLKDSDNE